MTTYVMTFEYPRGVKGSPKPIEVELASDEREAAVQEAGQLWANARLEPSPTGYVVWDMGQAIIEDDGTECRGACMFVYPPTGLPAAEEDSAGHADATH